MLSVIAASCLGYTRIRKYYVSLYAVLRYCCPYTQNIIFSLSPVLKVMLLFGYDCCSTATANGVAGVAEGQAGAAITAGGDSAGDILLRAMGIDGYDGRAIGVVSGAGAKPLGFSQASSVGCRRCPLLAQEQGVSAT